MLYRTLEVWIIFQLRNMFKKKCCRGIDLHVICTSGKGHWGLAPSASKMRLVFIPFISLPYLTTPLSQLHFRLLKEYIHINPHILIFINNMNQLHVSPQLAYQANINIAFNLTFTSLFTNNIFNNFNDFFTFKLSFKNNVYIISDILK